MKPCSHAGKRTSNFNSCGELSNADLFVYHAFVRSLQDTEYRIPEKNKIELSRALNTNEDVPATTAVIVRPAAASAEGLRVQLFFAIAAFFTETCGAHELWDEHHTRLVSITLLVNSK